MVSKNLKVIVAQWSIVMAQVAAAASVPSSLTSTKIRVHDLGQKQFSPRRHSRKVCHDPLKGIIHAQRAKDILHVIKHRLHRFILMLAGFKWSFLGFLCVKLIIPVSFEVDGIQENQTSNLITSNWIWRQQLCNFTLCLVSYTSCVDVFSSLLCSFEEVKLFHHCLVEFVARIFERWVEIRSIISIIRLFSKGPVGSYKLVLCASPIDFGDRRLETLMGIFTSATAFT